MFDAAMHMIALAPVACPKPRDLRPAQVTLLEDESAALA
jgi:hypothetical protein